MSGPERRSLVGSRKKDFEMRRSRDEDGATAKAGSSIRFATLRKGMRNHGDNSKDGAYNNRLNSVKYFLSTIWASQ